MTTTICQPAEILNAFSLSTFQEAQPPPGRALEFLFSSTILSEKYSLPKATLVVANIIAPVLEELFGEGLGEIVTPEGHLVLSGILKEQLPVIINCLEQRDFEVKKTLQEGDWVAVLAEKNTA
jgi:ribosomal protein L11 methylase PrmA